MTVATALALINDKLQSSCGTQSPSSTGRPARPWPGTTSTAGAPATRGRPSRSPSARTPRSPGWCRLTSCGPRPVTPDCSARLTSRSRATIPTGTCARRRGPRDAGVGALEKKGAGSSGPDAGRGQVAVQPDAVVDLTRLMYTIGENHKRSDDQQRFNRLVTEWPELVKSAREIRRTRTQVQPTLDDLTRWHVS